MSQRDPVIVNNRDGSSGALVAGVIAALLILLAIWYFGIREGDDADINIDVNVPTSVVPAP